MAILTTQDLELNVLKAEPLARKNVRQLAELIVDRQKRPLKDRANDIRKALQDLGGILELDTTALPEELSHAQVESAVEFLLEYRNLYERARKQVNALNAILLDDLQKNLKSAIEETTD